MRFNMVEEVNSRRVSQRSGKGPMNDKMINTPDGELSRVDSPPMTDRSNFVGTAPEENEDTQLLLNQGGA